MDKKKIIANTKSQTGVVENVFKNNLSSCDQIWIASPFFTNSQLLNKILSRKIIVRIIVGLQFPTSPKLLRSVIKNRKSIIETKFYDSDFHSKIYIFFNKRTPVAALVGSSNFTNAGMTSNIETNILLSSNQDLTTLKDHFEVIWNDSALLSPNDIDIYEEKFIQFNKIASRLKKEISKYQDRYVKPRLTNTRFSITKEAKEYFEVWKAIDEIAKIVQPLSIKTWPTLRTYLSVDHFWHWVKAVDKGKSIKKYKLTSENREVIIPKLFRDYISWDKQQEKYEDFSSKHLIERTRLLKSLLNPKRIARLSRNDAMTVYSNLHSGWMRIQRFEGDYLFAYKNRLERIRKSLNYLLWSSDDIDKRISALMKHPDYKLKHFGSSNIQELLGWVHNELPIRNKKADAAIKMLGFNYKLK